MPDSPLHPRDEVRARAPHPRASGPRDVASVPALSAAALAGCAVAALLVVAAPAGAQRPAELVGCHDGDTCVFGGFANDVRLARVDAPELDGPCAEAAREARDALLGLLGSASEIVVDSVGTGRYGRVIGEVVADTVNASDRLLRRGLAVPYGEDPCPGDGTASDPPRGGVP